MIIWTMAIECQPKLVKKTQKITVNSNQIEPNSRYLNRYRSVGTSGPEGNTQNRSCGPESKTIHQNNWLEHFRLIWNSELHLVTWLTMYRCHGTLCTSHVHNLNFTQFRSHHWQLRFHLWLIHPLRLLECLIKKYLTNC
jgi:hypothetical protein